MNDHFVQIMFNDFFQGNFTIDGVTCNTDAIPKVISAGEYAIEMFLSKNKEPFAIYRFIGIINAG